MKCSKPSVDFLSSATVPCTVVASIVGIMLMSVQPARAGSLVEDVLTGAGVGLGAGLILGDDFGVDDAANGAAAGAACHIANEEWQEEGKRNLGEDLVIGAVTAGGVGLITNDDNVLENAAQGAAACGVINVLD